VVQAADAQAAYIEVTGVDDGDSVSWSGSTTIAALNGQSISLDFEQPAGDRDIYARSIGINGDVSANSGPLSILVKSQVDTGGTGGSGGGSGGGGKNDGGTGTGGGRSESPSQQGGIY